jgi:hypothetical protein
MALSQTALARAIGIPPRPVNEIVLGKRAVTADRSPAGALFQNVGRFLPPSADRYELMQRQRVIGDQLKAIRPRAA